jgi:hypothetical protein
MAYVTWYLPACDLSCKVVIWRKVNIGWCTFNNICACRCAVMYVVPGREGFTAPMVSLYVGWLMVWASNRQHQPLNHKNITAHSSSLSRPSCKAYSQHRNVLEGLLGQRKMLTTVKVGGTGQSIRYSDATYEPLRRRGPGSCLCLEDTQD